MSTSTRRRARHKTAQAPAPEGTEKKCVLCHNTSAKELEDFGEGGDATGYWMCADVTPCVARARATVAELATEAQPEPEAAAAGEQPEPEDAAAETAEVSQ